MLFSLGFSTMVLVGCQQESADAPLAKVVAGDLQAHSSEFKQEVIRVADGVYVAVGFGLANVIMIEGRDGVVIVDTMESINAASKVKAEFRKITDKPIRAIVLTHNHADHVFGAQAFIEGEGDIPIYAHSTTNEHINKVINVLRPALYKRSMRMFGTFLADSQRPNDGIGPFLDMTSMKNVGLVRPTHTFDDELSLNIAGIQLQLIHAPGETDDQIILWLPDKKVLLPADNFYKSFPNLYTIRGTAYRDVLQWVSSLDAMRRLMPEVLVPSHGRPVSGKENIKDRLTNYRDAIQYVHDQTIRGINLGLTQDQLATSIQLPPHLTHDPYLQPFYGSVPSAVRSIFSGYLGWFSGSAVDLNSLTTPQRAKRWEEALAEGSPLLQQAQSALAKNDLQWALELAEMVLALDSGNIAAQSLKVSALTNLSEQSSNAPERNYLLSQALEASGALTIEQPEMSETPLATVLSFPIDNIMRSMPVNLKAEECLDTHLVVGFSFPNVNQEYTVTIRRGVAEVQDNLVENSNVKVTVASDTWKSIVTEHRNILSAYATGDLVVEGSIKDLVHFLSLFQRG
jgi:alkyl sulfatase BDS1-like metallo-beta-lactamase superfamily hydrolase